MKENSRHYDALQLPFTCFSRIEAVSTDGAWCGGERERKTMGAIDKGDGRGHETGPEQDEDASLRRHLEHKGERRKHEVEMKGDRD